MRPSVMPWDEPARLAYYGVDSGEYGNRERVETDRDRAVEDLARDLDPDCWNLADIMSVPESHEFASRQITARGWAQRAVDAGWRRQNER